MKYWVIALALFSSLAHAENWPRWRGPHFNGTSDETNLPSTLDPAANLLWSTPLPGLSAATPIIWDDRIFVSSMDASNQKLMAFCISRTDGKVLWKVAVGPGGPGNTRNQLASPSPVTDGHLVIFIYGTGDVAAFDMEGKPLWSRNLQMDFGKFSYVWMYGSSPLLWKDKLFIQVLHRADSFILAIDPQTGKDIWKHARPNDAAGESREDYTTPYPLDDPTTPQIIITGGDCATGHDIQSGQELWRCGGWNTQKATNWRIVPSPLVADDLLIVCQPRGNKVLAFNTNPKPGATPVWKADKLTSDCTTPLLYKGNLYVLDGDRRTISCANPKTGELLWQLALGGQALLRATPTASDGKIYCIDLDGEVFVASADEPKLLSRTPLGGGLAQSAIVESHGQVLVRAADKLYCFVKK